MSDEVKDLIEVEVAYALPDRQKIISLKVEQGTTAMEAVRRSGIVEQFPGIDIDSASMGIFGQVLGTKGLQSAETYVLQPLDRVEIYRPLIADPKEVRKARAQKAKLERGAKS